MSQSGFSNCACGSATSSIADGSQGRSGGSAWVSVYEIPKMDCPAEEQMIRLALGGQADIHSLSFDLVNRRLRVAHAGEPTSITDKLKKLGLGAECRGTVPAQPTDTATGASQDVVAASEARTLKWLLAINACMCVVELLAGWLAQSAGLVGDAIDMCADAAVYGLALYAVGRSLSLKQRAARAAGYLQMVLAMGVLLEVARRLVFGSEPESAAMMAVAALALVANVSCLVLVARHREGGVHMKASWIFSANDVLINLGVIVAGALVAWTGSQYPDLVIGALIGVIVLHGARLILALKA